MKIYHQKNRNLCSENCKVIDKCIGIRVRSFVNSFMLILKCKLAKGHLPRTTVLAQKAEPA